MKPWICYSPNSALKHLYMQLSFFKCPTGYPSVISIMLLYQDILVTFKPRSCTRISWSYVYQYLVPGYPDHISTTILSRDIMVTFLSWSCTRMSWSHFFRALIPGYPGHTSTTILYQDILATFYNELVPGYPEHISTMILYQNILVTFLPRSCTKISWSHLYHNLVPNTFHDPVEVYAHSNIAFSYRFQCCHF